MKIKLLIEAGDMKPGPAIGQQLGPLGVNIGQVISKVNEATSNFKGMKVPVELDINPKTKNFSVEVSSPPVSELLKKEISIEKGSKEAGKTSVGNLAIEQIIKVAKTKQPGMIVSSFKAAVKSVVGSCQSLGILIENKNAKQVQEEIDSGNYDKEIKSQNTEISPDKKEKLEKFFSVVQARQTKIAEEAAKLAEEAEKAKETAVAQPAATEETKEAKTEEIKTPEKKPKPAGKK